jgi:5-formyltetrahydrofolate cyclo-ligase
MAKDLVRKRIIQLLKNLSEDEIARQGSLIQNKLLGSDQYKKAKYIGVYLHTPKEAPTNKIIEDILRPGSNKVLFVPQVTGPTMKMVRIYSKEDLNSLPTNKWNIKEPNDDMPREDAIEIGQLDLLIIPGVAFDTNGHRLGRGKGYYDKFIHTLESRMKQLGRTNPFTIGLAFNEQLMPNIPMEEHDKILNMIITPNEVDVFPSAGSQ